MKVPTAALRLWLIRNQDTSPEASAGSIPHLVRWFSQPKTSIEFWEIPAVFDFRRVNLLLRKFIERSCLVDFERHLWLVGYGFHHHGYVISNGDMSLSNFVKNLWTKLRKTKQKTFNFAYIYTYIYVYIYIYIYMVPSSVSPHHPPQWVGSPGSTPPSLLFASYWQHFWGPASYLLGLCSISVYQPRMY